MPRYRTMLDDQEKIEGEATRATATPSAVNESDAEFYVNMFIRGGFVSRLVYEDLPFLIQIEISARIIDQGYVFVPRWTDESLGAYDGWHVRRRDA